MLKIYLFGLNGKMGKVMQLLAHEYDSTIVDGYTRSSEWTKIDIDNFDVIVDFSSHDCLPQILQLSTLSNKPIVIASTGHTQSQHNLILEHSHKIAVLQSSNMSIGINILLQLVANATHALSNWDIEILETHHKHKHDVPSGTAKTILNTISSHRPNTTAILGRQSSTSKRQPQDVGINSIRGGSHIGQHSAIYLGQSETLTITHTAQSRDIFAIGALQAAQWLVHQPAGLYDMINVLRD